MKRFLALLAFVSASTVFAQQAVKVGANELTARFNPLVAAVYKEIGLVPTFVNLPSERALKSVEAGELDADLGRVAGGTTGYQNMVETKESIVELQLVAVTTKDFKGGEITMGNLKNFKVGLARGSKIAEGAVAKLGIEATVANTTPQLFQMASAGRIDVILLASASPLSSFPEFAATMTQQTKPLLEAKTVHVMGSKLAATHAAKFDAAVKAMKADGRWAKLLSGG
jgi:ABC-type amino acid transport substrate-binding protein